jgi:hypothetical protein
MRPLYRSGALIALVGLFLAGCGTGSNSDKSGSPAPEVGPSEVVLEVPGMT